VISGLSVGVLVIEAAHASGSLITARWAADQGRNVYALPGRVDHPMSRGAHRLIREGAMLVESPDEIVRDLLGASEADRADEGPAPAAPVPEGARRILVELNGETLNSEEISLRLARPLPAVLVDLVALVIAIGVAPGRGRV
jgi:DNA processing protein